MTTKSISGPRQTDNQRGRPPKHNYDELLRNWESYLSRCRESNAHPSVKAFCTLEGISPRQWSRIRQKQSELQNRMNSWGDATGATPITPLEVIRNLIRDVLDGKGHYHSLVHSLRYAIAMFVAQNDPALSETEVRGEIELAVKTKWPHWQSDNKIVELMDSLVTNGCGCYRAAKEANLDPESMEEIMSSGWRKKRTAN